MNATTRVGSVSATRASLTRRAGNQIVQTPGIICNDRRAEAQKLRLRPANRTGQLVTLSLAVCAWSFTSAAAYCASVLTESTAPAAASLTAAAAF